MFRLYRFSLIHWQWLRIWLDGCRLVRSTRSLRKIYVGKLLWMGTECEDKFESLVNAPQRAISEKDINNQVDKMIDLLLLPVRLGKSLHPSELQFSYQGASNSSRLTGMTWNKECKVLATNGCVTVLVSIPSGDSWVCSSLGLLYFSIFFLSLCTTDIEAELSRTKTLGVKILWLLFSTKHLTFLKFGMLWYRLFLVISNSSAVD